MIITNKLKSLFKKKHQFSKKEIIKLILEKIGRTDSLLMPLYISDIYIPSDGNKYEKILPLIYVWNENVNTRQYIVSTNGLIVANLLEAYYVRTDPNFNSLRDELLKLISNIAAELVQDECEKYGCLPSQLYENLEVAN